MALLLVPYDDPMRLGMGFNTFAQQLCINDAVKLKGKLCATEHDLCSVNGPGTGIDVNENGTGTDICQDVSWKAKIVDRISEVTESMNISSSLHIKCDAIGNGGSATVSFINATKFADSDTNYMIQVRVTNRRLLAPDLNEWSAVDGLPESEFTRICGDSFISGFTEGGEFNALVSIKLKDRSQTENIRGKLKADLDIHTGSVSDEEVTAMTRTLTNIDGETTIRVSWRGGEIKDRGDADWTIETLQAVVMEFPERAMACPVRTHAIITKYTQPSSLSRMPIKGTPLDYENAGVYSFALLDAYMEYKVILHSIQTAAMEVELGTCELAARPDIPELAELSQKSKANYYNRIADYNLKRDSAALGSHATSAHNAVEAQWLAPSSDHQRATASLVLPSPSEPPMPPNDLVPYKANIFGLDKARRDCRSEMVKIVREVDAVVEDPKVASDPSRRWQFLCPPIFRMLLPSVRNLDEEKAALQAVEDAKNFNEGKAQVERQLRTDSRWRRGSEGEPSRFRR